MKQTTDPWTIRKDKKTSKPSAKRMNESGEVDSPSTKKRKSVEESDSSGKHDSDLSIAFRAL